MIFPLKTAFIALKRRKTKCEIDFKDIDLVIKNRCAYKEQFLNLEEQNIGTSTKKGNKERV